MFLLSLGHAYCTEDLKGNSPGKSSQLIHIYHVRERCSFVIKHKQRNFTFLKYTELLQKIIIVKHNGSMRSCKNATMTRGERQSFQPKTILSTFHLSRFCHDHIVSRKTTSTQHRKSNQSGP